MNAKKTPDAKLKNKYVVFGKVPRIGFIEEFVWAHSRNQAIKLIRDRCARNPDYARITIPPLGPYCRAWKISSDKTEAPLLKEN